jgi:hypothetical protein
MYHGALTIVRRILFWKRCRISIFEWEAEPQRGIPYVHTGFNIDLSCALLYIVQKRPWNISWTCIAIVSHKDLSAKWQTTAYTSRSRSTAQAGTCLFVTGLKPAWRPLVPNTELGPVQSKVPQNSWAQAFMLLGTKAVCSRRHTVVFSLQKPPSTSTQNSSKVQATVNKTSFNLSPVIQTLDLQNIITLNITVLLWPLHPWISEWYVLPKR